MDSTIDDHATCISLFDSCRTTDDDMTVVALGVDLSADAPFDRETETVTRIRTPEQPLAFATDRAPPFKIPIA